MHEINFGRGRRLVGDLSRMEWDSDIFPAKAAIGA